jgi:hypothetical protein
VIGGGVSGMQSGRGAAAALLLSGVLAAVAGGGCDGGNPPPGPDRGDGGTTDGLPAAPACAWSAQPPELKAPGGEVKGTLRGTSRNTSTTCTRQKGTGGPEAIYLLRLSERALIELEVTSTIDTVIAVRRVCDDPLTELACNDTPPGADPSNPTFPPGVVPVAPPPPIAPIPFPPPPPPPDARLPDARPVDASPPDGGPPDGATVLPQVIINGPRDAHLRAVLDPGNYFVVIDEAEPFGVGGDYTLKTTIMPPLAQSSCNTAQGIQDGTSLPSEELDLASERATSCTGSEQRPALYYRATIPAGQRLTARALPALGDRPWSPVMQLVTACSQAMCLATDRASPDGQQRMLRYVNNGSSDQPVLLTVGANTAVSGANVRLDVSIGAPLQNGTCASARPLSDGQVLRNQDLSEGQPSPDGVCKPPGTPSLFYSATLFEQQRLRVMASQSNLVGRAPLFMMLREGCSDTLCRGSMGELVDYTNPGPGTRTVIIEVGSFPGLPLSLFDLQVSMPPPPAAISVTPTRDLQTSEAGGQATFQVALASPPLQPLTIPVRSLTPAEGTPSPAELLFTAANWQQPQTVTVTGVDDAAADGARPYQVQVGPASSVDTRYSSLPASTVSLLNRDDEPGFYLSGRLPMVTSESGSKATFMVVLNRAPAATVRLPLSTSDAGEGTVAPAELVFEPQTWNQPQTVTVTGVDDQDRDGSQAYRVVTGAAVSADAAYGGLDPDDLDVRNADNEFERVTAQLVSGNLSCQPVSSLGSRMAADAEGNLFVAMPCVSPFGTPPVADAGVAGPGEPVAAPRPSRDTTGGPNLFVAASLDGGRTFRPPVDTRVAAFEVVVATTDSGVVVLGAGPFGVFAVRSEDRGATWQPPEMLSSPGGNLRLAAAGKLVVASADPGTGPQLWVSADGGLSFRQPVVPIAMMQMVALGIDPASGEIWLVTYDGQTVGLRLSKDSGVSFQDVGPIAVNTFFDTVTLGPRSVFATGKDPALTVVSRDLATRRTVDGLFPTFLFPRVVVADAADNAVVLESQDGTVQARRLPAGATSFLPAKNLGTSQMFPSPAVLSENAVAAALWSSGQVFVAVETWP